MQGEGRGEGEGYIRVKVRVMVKVRDRVKVVIRVVMRAIITMRVIRICTGTYIRHRTRVRVCTEHRLNALEHHLAWYDAFSPTSIAPPSWVRVKVRVRVRVSVRVRVRVRVRVAIKIKVRVIGTNRVKVEKVRSSSLK